MPPPTKPSELQRRAEYERRAEIARFLGWFAFVTGGICWCCAGWSTNARWPEAVIEELYLSAFFGILAAVALGFAVRAARLGGEGITWLALFANAIFLVLVVSRFVRRM